MKDPKFVKGFNFAKKQAAQFGVEQTEKTMNMIFAANKGRPATDPYVMGVRAGLAEAAG